METVTGSTVRIAARSSFEVLTESLNIPLLVEYVLLMFRRLPRRFEL